MCSISYILKYLVDECKYFRQNKSKSPGKMSDTITSTLDNGGLRQAVIANRLSQILADKVATHNTTYFKR